MKTSTIFSYRIKKLQAKLRQEKLDFFFVDDPYDLFYLTGMQVSLGHLFVHQNKARFFVDGRYFEIVSKMSPVPVELLSEKNQIAFLKGGKKLGFDGDKITYSCAIHVKKYCRKGNVKTVSNPHLMKSLRLIKDEKEILKMKKSAAFAYKAYKYVRGKLKPGVTEIQLTRELEIYCLKNGAEKMSFEPIIAFGKNTALPHHHPGKTSLKKNDVVLFDLGVVLDGYCSDMTRVDFVGKKDPKILKLYEVNREAQKAALAKCKPGVALKELDRAARKVMAKASLEEYFIHSLGHGIGLEVHEHPRIKYDGPDRNLKLESGMVITIEPGLYLPGKGGVRYEDTVVITPKGYKNLYPEK